MMTQSFSVCLPLLALLVSFPCGQAGEVGSLESTSVLSNVLHKYFARREAHGQKVPSWKPEVEAVMSLVESVGNSEDPKHQNRTTQDTVNVHVKQIIDLLELDVDRTFTAQKKAAEALEGEKTACQDAPVHEAEIIYKKLKTGSSNAQACHEQVDSLKSDYTNVENCGAGDIEDAACSCTVNSVFDFELTDTAKALHWCEFAADPPETAQTCIDELWAEVNKTRATLRNSHTIWLKEKKDCEQKRAKCGHCLPLWNKILTKDGECHGRHEGIYSDYCLMQDFETSMCTSKSRLASSFATKTDEQSDRVKEWQDLRFVICIFDGYLKADPWETFTRAAMDACSTKYGGPDSANPEFDEVEFYKLVEQPGGLQSPTLDMSKVPTCDAQSPPQGVAGLGGLTYLWSLDKRSAGTAVSITSGTFQPAATDVEINCNTD